VKAYRLRPKGLTKRPFGTVRGGKSTPQTKKRKIRDPADGFGNKIHLTFRIGKEKGSGCKRALNPGEGHPQSSTKKLS